MVVAGSVRAQSPNATVTGEVVDPSGAAIAGATVEVINEATNLKYSSKTSREGIYVIPELPPATYRIEVSHVGFKTVLKPDVIFNVRDAVAINFKLPLGATSETVTVEAGASMLNTVDASVSTVVDQTYVKNTPLNGRSFQDLILLTPGIVTQTPQGSNDGGEFSVNGNRTQSNYYTVDGVSANVGAFAGFVGSQVPLSGSTPAATASGTTQALVSVDALEEFRVQSSTYSAEYGRSPGGQFAFETKSGTNQWHGTAYDYLRNDYFDANDWFNNYLGQKGAALRQNDFGGTLGAPVRIPGLFNGKDKTFFFVSYEGLRLTSPQPACTNCFVPDTALRASAPAAVQQALNAFPLPSANGIDDVANGFGQYIGTWSNPSSIDSTNVRFDHVVSDKLRLFFRFSDTASNSSTRGTPANRHLPTTRETIAYTLRTYTAGATSVFSNLLTNEFRINYSSNETTDTSVIDAFGGSTPVDLRQLSGLDSKARALFTIVFGGYFFRNEQSYAAGAQKQWNFVETLSLSLGRHRLKFGADYRRLAPLAAPPSPTFQYAYVSRSRLLANNAIVIADAFTAAYPLYKNFSAFAQDEWKVSPRVSLSLGLRWDVNPAPGVTQGLKPYAYQGSTPDTWTLAPQGTPLWRTAWYNFAPRLGVAYILHNTSGWETVVRGGGGVFFDTGQQVGSYGFNGPGFRGHSVVPSDPFPTNGPALIPVIVNPPVPPYSNGAQGFASHLQLPYTLEWNASIEQALGKSQALTFSYVGSHAARLLKEVLVFPGNNPAFASGTYFTSNGLTSDYHSLQIQFQRRLRKELTALAAYTWSHCVDYGSLNFQVDGYQRGNCDFDVRHNLSAALSYDLPTVRHSGFANAVLHHWGIDGRLTARTAFPVILAGDTIIDPVTDQAVSSGLDLVPNEPVYLYGANCTTVLQGLGDLQPGQGCPGGRAINPNAFAPPPTDPNTGNPTRPGNAPRNFARGFDAVQMNLAVRRDFPIHERLKLQFRAEAFNVFNHPNFGTVNPFFGEKTFGQATGILATSLGILNPLYQQGGPRSMQFALRLAF